MSYYYDEDFYHETSEFDMFMNEVKTNLMKSVKEEYVSEMERLRKENEELQEVKKNFEQIKRDFENKKRELSSEYEQLKLNVRRERLNELMKDYEVELYSVASYPELLPKCEKCDDNRRIYYKTPLGKDTYEMCECSNKIHLYEPIPILLSSFSIDNGKGHAWYKIKDRGKYDEYLQFYDESISGKELITDENQIESIKYSYKVLFKTEELAQKYCDIKNKDATVTSSRALRKR